MTEATEKLTLLYFYECKYNQKGVNSFDFERIDSFSFGLITLFLSLK